MPSVVVTGVSSGIGWGTAKVLLQHPNATTTAHAFDIVVELGADMNQGRYVDPHNLADELGCSRADARIALRDAALALTRASLLAGASDDDEDEVDEESNGEA